MLHDEMTGSGDGSATRKVHNDGRLTCVITSNGRLHDSLHPLSNDRLVIRAEKVHLVLLVLNAESVLARVHILVHSDPVPDDVDVALDLRLLKRGGGSAPARPLRFQHAYRWTLALQAIEMWTFQDEVPVLPTVVPIPTFPHPPTMIRLPYLLENVLARLERARNVLIVVRQGGASSSARVRRCSLPKKVRLLVFHINSLLRRHGNRLAFVHHSARRGRSATRLASAGAVQSWQMERRRGILLRNNVIPTITVTTRMSSE